MPLQTRAAEPARVHTQEQFEFTAEAPVEEVFPLFGAERERAWDPDWAPQFVWPLPARDEEGMVFTVAHGPGQAVWVNTQFDPQAHRVGYAYVLPGHFTTRIALQLTPIQGQTRVEVHYERTSLVEAADDMVRHLAGRDRVAGPQWAAMINGYLKSRPR
jgi:hypothetical protein